jgi:glycosyltransferase involved in cell wall biosynthesis
MLVLIAGRDPEGARADGSASYVRAHARAAVRAGYSPQILCVGATAETRETDFGVVRRIASRVQPVRPLMIPAHGPLMARAVVDLAPDKAEPVLVHGFGGVWAWSAVRGAAELRKRGHRAVSIVSSYATHSSESESQARGVPRGAGWRATLLYRGQLLWSRSVVARYEGQAYRGADAVYINYDSVRRLIVDEYGPEIAIDRLPYGPEADFLGPPEPDGAGPPGVRELQPPDAPLVVSVGYQRPRKGTDVLIDALAIARDRGTPLRACLVGGGPHLDLHGRQLDDRGLAGSAALVGEVPDSGAYVRRADIFAQPSRGEQSGSLALLEALREGVAVVASNVDGIPEDVIDGESALLVEPGDPAALATALERLAADPALRARIAAGGRRVFEERFAAEPFSAALGAAYAEHGVGPP